MKDLVCRNCRETGHTLKDCKSTAKCWMCGKAGHAKASCPDRTCQLCLKPGHLAKGCPWLKEPCQWCEMVGHGAKECVVRLGGGCLLGNKRLRFSRPPKKEKKENPVPGKREERQAQEQGQGGRGQDPNRKRGGNPGRSRGSSRAQSRGRGGLSRAGHQN